MTVAPEQPRAGKLTRSVGFYGLMFVSLGSIIGSGWLLGGLTAAETAGPASIISWMLAAAMLATLALVYAELGATYPVAGGSGRYPSYSHGPIVGFIGGWAAWVQAVFIAPIEVLAAITYVNSVSWVNEHFPMLDAGALLNHRGLVVAVGLMFLFTAMNLAGAKFLSESNTWVVIWKTAVPFLAIGVVASLSFHPSNFTAGGGFMPFGFVSANLILYWGGIDVNLKVLGAIGAGLVVFVIGTVVRRTHACRHFRTSWWVPVWLGGVLLIGWLGQYGDSARGTIPSGLDLVVMMVWGLVIYRLAIALRLEPNGVSEEVAKDAHQLEGLDELTTA